MNSFHGTAVSLFQLPTDTQHGESLPSVTIQPTGNRNHSLPESYASVPPVALKTSTIKVPASHTRQVQSGLEEARAQEDEWVKHALQLLDKDELSQQDTIAWAAYHASLQPTLHVPKALCSLLPLFYGKAATPAMIKHGMDV